MLLYVISLLHSTLGSVERLSSRHETKQPFWVQRGQHPWKNNTFGCREGNEREREKERKREIERERERESAKSLKKAALLGADRATPLE